MEIKFCKKVLKALKKTLLTLKTASMANGMTVPEFHLFIIKQAFVSSEPKIGLLWPEAKSRLQQQNQATNFDTHQNSQLPYMVRASLAKHAVTQDGYACLEFRVRKWRSDGTGKLEEHLIHITQNNHSLVTEVRILGDNRIYEIVHATIAQRGGDCTFIKILFAFIHE